MGKKVSIQVAPEDRDRLEALIANGNKAQKQVRRARIVLLVGDGIGTDEIHRRLRVRKPTIRRWRTRYIEAGVDGLCATRRGRPARRRWGRR
jgi:transposase